MCSIDRLKEGQLDASDVLSPRQAARFERLVNEPDSHGYTCHIRRRNPRRFVSGDAAYAGLVMLAGLGRQARDVRPACDGCPGGRERGGDNQAGWTAPSARGQDLGMQMPRI
jgi:hypothetical protein